MSQSLGAPKKKKKKTQTPARQGGHVPVIGSPKKIKTTDTCAPRRTCPSHWEPKKKRKKRKHRHLRAQAVMSQSLGAQKKEKKRKHRHLRAQAVMSQSLGAHAVAPVQKK